MPRFKITVEYDGTGLAGWQKQDDQYSVQESLEKALSKATGQEIGTVASGRTDAGVHALGQVVHFDLDGWQAFKIKEALNFYLRQDDKLPYHGQVSVLDAEEADSEFSARFSAIKRHYIYRIINRRAHLTLERNRAWNIQENLDTDKMAEAAKIFVGQHDFTSFTATECQAKSPVKTLDLAEVTRVGELIEIRFSARSFLHHQVRNMTGSLRLIGNGKWNVGDLKAAFAAKDRTKAGETAPPGGLYLVKIDY